MCFVALLSGLFAKGFKVAVECSNFFPRMVKFDVFSKQPKQKGQKKREKQKKSLNYYSRSQKVLNETKQQTTLTTYNVNFYAKRLKKKIFLY